MPKPKTGKSRSARKGGTLIGGGVNQRKQLEAIGYGLNSPPPAKRGKARVVGSKKKK